MGPLLARKTGSRGPGPNQQQRRVGRRGIHCLGVVLPVFLAVTRGRKVRGQSWGGRRVPERRGGAGAPCAGPALLGRSPLDVRPHEVPTDEREAAHS